VGQKQSQRLGGLLFSMHLPKYRISMQSFTNSNGHKAVAIPRWRSLEQLMLRLRDLWSLWLLSRPLNLLIGGLTLALSAYLSDRAAWRFLIDELFWSEAGLTLLIMAGGYWLNDVFDYKIDRINRPERTLVGRLISRKKVLAVYAVLMGGVLAAGLALPFKFQLVNSAAILTLAVYAGWFKRRAVVGNVLIAGLAALVVFTGGLFYHLTWAIFWGMVFAFYSTLLREMVKDVEDIQGDLRYGLRTLPILIGLRASKRVLFPMYSGLVVLCWVPAFEVWRNTGTWPVGYLLISIPFVQVPLVVGMRALWRALRPSAYRYQSLLLKGVMVSGLVSLLGL